ncbi:Predicted pyrophosphatase or phosphodiesterase, AlkP superfamily [Rhizobiales bacterium GAS113]|nr:Predicted pyrophosphatase or phosphodiesterase, AlkP superfamily [Rhizobiales bacterium GAS113]
MNRVVAICLDALRPSAIEPSAMPNLSRFIETASRFSRHRSIFPSDTRANAATLVTGMTCDRHGINGNAFLIGKNRRPTLVDTGSAASVAQADLATGGRLFRARTLDKILSANGRSLAVISSASAGTTTLLHMRAAGHADAIRISCHDRTLSVPSRLVDAIERDLGPPPPVGAPDISAIEYGVNVFLGHVWPKAEPDCTIMWLNEPDVSYHEFGVDSEKTADTLAFVDSQLGRIFDWWDTGGRARGVQLLLFSDHGQVDVNQHIDVVSELRAGGLDACWVGEGAGELCVVPGGFGQIYVRSAHRLPDVAEFLGDQPWSGLLFGSGKSRAIERLIPAKAVLYENPRTADIVFTFRNGRRSGSCAGGSAYYGGRSMNAAMHGGLDPEEMTALFVAAGSEFESSALVEAPTNTADIMPTILQCIDIPIPDALSDRSLAGSEARASDRWLEETIEQVAPGRRQVVRRFRVGPRYYVDSGWVE